jgi:cation diffusion facilitator family transporter
VSAGEESPRAIVAALAANIGIAILKFLAFLLTSSASMLAESIHSLADSGNQALLLLGRKRSERSPDELHPFGYGRDRYIYAFIVSIVLFSVGGLFALYEGYHKVREPHPLESWAWVPIVVLLGAIAMEGFSFRTAIVESRKVMGDSGWWEFIRRARSPELPVVLLEDFAALIGLMFALCGVVLTIVTGNGVFDGLGSVAIGVLLCVVAVVLAVETKSLLLGESAVPGAVATIERTLAAQPGIDRVIHLRTMHLGPDELLIAAKVAIPPDLSAVDLAAIIDAAEAAVRDQLQVAALIYLEPDIDQGSTSPEAHPAAPSLRAPSLREDHPSHDHP